MKTKHEINHIGCMKSIILVASRVPLQILIHLKYFSP